MIRKHHAIRSLRPDSLFVIDNGTVVWQDETQSEPTEEAIEAELSRLQTAYDSQAYSRSRKAKYDLLNQDELRYDDLINSTTTWPDAIAAIKLEFPK